MSCQATRKIKGSTGRVALGGRSYATRRKQTGKGAELDCVEGSTQLWMEESVRQLEEGLICGVQRGSEEEGYWKNRMVALNARSTAHASRIHFSWFFYAPPSGYVLFAKRH
ncbi:hypothetical protein DEO72_LG5g2670 [Vigna unguiculata]|uniref:Uncharacterized protein n=1 Tax=Vigna unguiculata TaxID=3917 RepID=A0A4D6M0I5_VIGUN|nr:hypothetical protein DEO72_LG5g2670 [Vigna unguiculata]